MAVRRSDKRVLVLLFLILDGVEDGGFVSLGSGDDLALCGLHGNGALALAVHVQKLAQVETGAFQHLGSKSEYHVSFSSSTSFARVCLCDRVCSSPFLSDRVGLCVGVWARLPHLYYWKIGSNHSSITFEITNLIHIMRRTYLDFVDEHIVKGVDGLASLLDIFSDRVGDELVHGFLQVSRSNFFGDDLDHLAADVLG